MVGNTVTLTPQHRPPDPKSVSGISSLGRVILDALIPPTVSKKPEKQQQQSEPQHKSFGKLLV